MIAPLHSCGKCGPGMSALPFDILLHDTIHLLQVREVAGLERVRKMLLFEPSLPHQDLFSCLSRDHAWTSEKGLQHERIRARPKTCGNIVEQYKKILSWSRFLRITSI